MLEYYDVSGCYILRPWAYTMWEHIQEYFNTAIKKSGVKNAYFPMFVSRAALNREEDELEGFGAEVAWVTKSGKTDLAEPIAVRPTSETVIYPAFKKWITSHRDMPLRINQWCNIVRWEFKHPVPFIRTREFLWQEGHSAFSTLEEASAEVMEILHLYASVYEDLLAVPVVRGRKSEKEKFAGALFTTTIESLIPANGRAIQAATSHCLGQTFAKMFGVEFESEKHEKQFAWQNSWGLTTRSIGVCVMVHGDDKGLVLPPRVAPIQCVVIPLRYKDSEEVVRKRAIELAGVVKACGVRVHVDDTDHTGGWKYNHWEVKGVPLRLELGPKDLAAEQCVLVRRDLITQGPAKAKETVRWVDLCARVPQLLEEIQRSMFQRAVAERDSRIVRVTEWAKFGPALDAKNMCLCTWCGKTPCEEDIKARSAKESLERAAASSASLSSEEQQLALTGAAKTLCTPFDQPQLPQGAKCFACGQDAVSWTLFGRSY
jgi:prolyl-tRNA synthetase